MSSNQLLLKYAAKYPWLILLTIVLGTAGALFNGVGTVLIVPILLEFLGEEALNPERMPALLQQLLSLFDSFSGDARLLAMLGAVILLIIFKNLTTYFSSLSGGYLSRALVNEIRLEGLQMLLDVDIDFYSKSKIGDIVNRLGGETSKAASAIRLGVETINTAITILTFLGLLLFLSWQITLITTFLLLVVAFLNRYFIRKARLYGRIVRDKSRDYSNQLLEILTGIRLIKSVGYEDKEYQEIRQLVIEREMAQFQAQIVSAMVSPVNEIAGILIVLSIAILGRYLFYEQLQALTTALLTYLLALFRLMPYIGKLNQARSQFANAAPSVEVVEEFLRREDKPLMVKNSALYKPLQECIEFRNVSFAYPGHQGLVLKDLNVLIPKGKSIALVGASGAGKSTVADLLPRFYDPTNGQITFDGRDVREFGINSLRRAMGIVSQDTFLFNNSVRYNIAYGMDEVGESEIIEAAKRANAYEFIVQLPQGFDTEIGDRGVMLSGGQRQRLAIARALLRNPDVLILDEATSALDTVSERLVQQAIDELCRDRTTLVIAHRLSTVQNAHQIVVLDRGHIVEVGNHQELLARGGYYSRLYSMQFANSAKPEESVDDAQLKSFYKSQMHLSYNARTSLSSMLGSLRLVADGLVDTSEERLELLEESYISAVRLLNSIERFEKNTHHFFLDCK
ncbi:MAG: ABC transporter ATP-binding protein [Cyanophyceae cyanobacterium]